MTELKTVMDDATESFKNMKDAVHDFSKHFERLERLMSVGARKFTDLPSPPQVTMAELEEYRSKLEALRSKYAQSPSTPAPGEDK